VPDELALRLASLLALRAAPNVVLIAEKAGLAIADAATTLFAISDRFALDRLRSAALALPVGNHYDRMAVDTALAAVGVAERGIAVAVAKRGVGKKAVEAWAAATPASVRAAKTLDEIVRSGLSMSKLTVAADMLGGLVET
jgi:glutamate dehydrogenase